MKIFNFHQSFLTKLKTYDWGSFWRHFWSLLFTALFLACFVEIVKHHSQSIMPSFERLAYTIASNRSANHSTTDCKGNCSIVIIGLSQQPSPEYPCTILADAKRIIDTLKPRTLFIAYDFSPLYLKQTLHVSSCEHTDSKLIDIGLLLDGLAKNTNIVLIEPAEEKDKSDWMLERKRTNIIFTDGKVEVSAGMALKYRKNSQSVAAVLCNSMGCGKTSVDKMKSKDYPFLNFSAYFNNVLIYQSERDAIKNKKLAQEDLLVMMGNLSSKKTYITPVNTKTQWIELYAAAYASHREEVKRWAPIKVLVADILLGMLVGWFAIMGWGWLRERSFSGSVVFPPIMLVLMLACMVAAVWFSLILAEWQLTRNNVWLNPAPMVIGMIVHAFVMTPTELIGTKNSESQASFKETNTRLAIYIMGIMNTLIIVAGLNYYFHWSLETNFLTLKNLLLNYLV